MTRPIARKKPFQLNTHIPNPIVRRCLHLQYEEGEFDKNNAHSNVFRGAEVLEIQPNNWTTNCCTATAMTTPRLCHTPSQAETWRESLGLGPGS
jgi:hypothetical protein